jgi:hypothetical protein
MKYAITYTKNFRHYDEVDEVIFPYKGISDEEGLIEIVTNTLTREDQRAIILVDKYEQSIDDLIPIVRKLKTVHENMVVSLNLDYQHEWIDKLKEAEIPFMFVNFATTVTQIAAMVIFGAKEVYLAEDICFMLPRLQLFRDIDGIKFRIFPDILQTPRRCASLPQVTNFFIRPEDVDLYEKYVDVIEIFRKDSRQSVVYEIYKQGQWRGPLSDLIIDLEEEINGSSFIPDFGRARLGCGRRCAMTDCDICTYSVEVGHKMEEAGVAFVKQKKKREASEDIKKQAEEVMKKMEQADDNK